MLQGRDVDRAEVTGSDTRVVESPRRLGPPPHRPAAGRAVSTPSASLREPVPGRDAAGGAPSDRALLVPAPFGAHHRDRAGRRPGL